MLVPLRKHAEAIANYLEQQHWKNTPEDGEIRKQKKNFLKKMTEQEGKMKIRQRKAFTDKQLEEAIKLTKKGKAPGPDGISMEPIKWLSKDNRKWLLNMINQWWKKKQHQKNYTLQE